MKKACINLLTIAALSCLNIAPALAKIYLQNNYGAPIEFVEQPSSMAHRFKETTLGNGASKEIAKIQSVRETFNPPITSLSIRSVSGNYADISHKVQEARNLQARNRGKDVIIGIYPREGFSGIYNWNVKVEWAPEI